MIQLTNKRLLALICFVMSIGILISCRKENTRTDQIQLLSFGPTGAKHGDTLRFFGTNLDKVTEVVFTGTNASVKQNEFKKQTWEEILLIVPKAAEKGFVTLKTPQGDIVSKTQINLSVASRVTTMPAPARPGESITLKGEHLNWVKSVTFNKDIVVTNFTSKSLNQLVVTIPENAQTGRLLLSYGGTDSTAVETDTLWVKLPVATSIAPASIKHAEDLTITGTDLDLTKQVLFTGVSTPVTSFVSQSATQLVVKVPGGARKGKLTLVAASGVSTQSSSELDIIMPVVSTLSPSPIDPGANLTVTGTDLDLVSSITFSNAPAVTTFVSQSATQIVVTVPMGVLRGKVTFGVKNSSLTVQSPDVLEITGDVPPPTIAFPIYNDAVTSNWNGWIGGGWGGTSDRNNAAPVREGSKSVRINYVGGYGSPFQVGGANISLAPFTALKLSVYGAPGSAGKRITIGINGVNGKYNITLVEGKWTDYEIPLSTLTTESVLKEIWIQEYSGTGGFTIYVDALGLN